MNPTGLWSKGHGNIIVKMLTPTSRVMHSLCLLDCLVPESPRWPSTRFLLKGSDDMWNRYRPLPACSLVGLINHQLPLSRVYRLRYLLIRSRPRKTPGLRSVLLPKFMIICGCCGHVSVFHTAQSVVSLLLSKHPSKSWISCLNLKSVPDSRYWRRWYEDVRASSLNFLPSCPHKAIPEPSLMGSKFNYLTHQS